MVLILSPQCKDSFKKAVGAKWRTLGLIDSFPSFSSYSYESKNTGAFRNVLAFVFFRNFMHLNYRLEIFLHLHKYDENHSIAIR